MDIGDPDKQVRSATAVAIRLLAMREHSRFEMQSKLSARGFGDSEIEAVLDTLTEQKYLDDGRFAEMLARHYSNLGRKGLIAQMTKRGISPELWEPLVEGIGAEEEFARALAAAESKTPVAPSSWEEREKWRRRTASFLARRGFSQATVLAVLGSLQRGSADG